MLSIQFAGVSIVGSGRVPVGSPGHQVDNITHVDALGIPDQQSWN
jgi:hypothetical protein